MSTQGSPRHATPRATAPRGLPRVVSAALIAVLVGAGLLALQNCGGETPVVQPPPPPATPTGSTPLPQPPEQPPMPPVT